MWDVLSSFPMNEVCGSQAPMPAESLPVENYISVGGCEAANTYEGKLYSDRPVQRQPYTPVWSFEKNTAESYAERLSEINSGRSCANPRSGGHPYFRRNSAYLDSRSRRGSPNRFRGQYGNDRLRRNPGAGAWMSQMQQTSDEIERVYGPAQFQVPRSQSLSPSPRSLQRRDRPGRGYDKTSRENRNARRSSRSGSRSRDSVSSCSSSGSSSEPASRTSWSRSRDRPTGNQILRGGKRSEKVHRRLTDKRRKAKLSRTFLEDQDRMSVSPGVDLTQSYQHERSRSPADNRNSGHRRGDSSMNSHRGRRKLRDCDPSPIRRRKSPRGRQRNSDPWERIEVNKGRARSRSTDERFCGRGGPRGQEQIFERAFEKMSKETDVRYSTASTSASGDEEIVDQPKLVDRNEPASLPVTGAAMARGCIPTPAAAASLKRNICSSRLLFGRMQPLIRRENDSPGYKPPSRNRRGRSPRRARSRSRSWAKTDPNIDSDEEYRRSRSRERERRRKQYATIQKFCKNVKSGEYQVFWDGFQWCKKTNATDGPHGVDTICYDQMMNATRRARRLHVGNLPLHLNINEDEFRSHLWETLRASSLLPHPDECPILNVWFARERGGNFGFVEMATVEDAHVLLKLDGFSWHGCSIRVNRPADWRRSINEIGVKLLEGASGLAVAESLTAAAQQAATTGNISGLLKIVEGLPEQQRRSITELLGPSQCMSLGITPSTSLPALKVERQLRNAMLSGNPSTILRVLQPSADLHEEQDYNDVLEDVMSECSKFGGILKACIARPEHVEGQNDAQKGDVFFEFSTIGQVDDCIMNLSGRLYEGRPIRLMRFDEATWVRQFKQHSTAILDQKLRGLR